MKPEVSARCHQTLSCRWSLGTRLIYGLHIHNSSQLWLQSGINLIESLETFFLPKTAQYGQSPWDRHIWSLGAGGCYTVIIHRISTTGTRSGGHNKDVAAYWTVPIHSGQACKNCANNRVIACLWHILNRWRFLMWRQLNNSSTNVHVHTDKNSM